MKVNSIKILDNIKEIQFLLDISVGTRKMFTLQDNFKSYAKNNVYFTVMYIQWSGYYIRYKNKMYSAKPFKELIT